MKGEDTKARILEAAERVVAERGVSGLTLDAVAEAAGLSKGGLIYHFQSKEALITAMLDRRLSIFERRIAEHRATDREPGSWTRGYLAASLASPRGGGERSSAGAALLVAIASDPSLIAPVRERQRAWAARLRADGGDPVVGAIVRLAADGLWMNEIFGIEPFSPEERRAVLQRLQEMTRGKAG